MILTVRHSQRGLLSHTTSNIGTEREHSALGCAYVCADAARKDHLATIFRKIEDQTQAGLDSLFKVNAYFNDRAYAWRTQLDQLNKTQILGEIVGLFD